MTPRTLGTFTDTSRDDGLTRSARLLRAIGPNAAPIWAQLSASDSAALRAAMDELPDDDTANAEAAQALLNQAARQGALPVWQKLSALPPRQLLAMLQSEHPQLIALTVARLTPQAAGALLTCMPPQLAEETMHRVLRTGRPHPSAIAAIETLFETELGLADELVPVQGDAALARILDVLASDKRGSLLDAIGSADPKASARVRELMFTFEDIAGLAPAGLQTLLSRIDRATLTLALKGVEGPVADAIYGNMTTRAREVLVEEIAATGRVRRADVEAARTDMIILARHLIETGDIQRASEIDDLLEDTGLSA
ncbi:MAG: FliG C-terminal domain-containing protein [Hyphomonadaceae bacterium]